MPAALADRLIEELRQKQATYTAQLKGDGTIVQGDDSWGIGVGGVGIKNSSITGDVKVENYYHLPTDASPEELRAAYLNHLLEAASQLQLSGIDRKTASDAEARLELGAVYTALLTRTMRMVFVIGDENGIEQVDAPLGKVRHLSALEELGECNRLVLLGDPGSGKSTFVNFVAMCLAGERLGSKAANLSALTMPLPVDDDVPHAGRDKKEKPQPQPWQHGALLPVRVILRDFAARGLPPAGEAASAKTLWDFIVSELDGWALRDFEKPLAQELREKGGLLLLDGLDEVPEADARRAQIKQAIEGFAASFPKCRILVTSRTYAYQKQDWRLNDFAESVLAPFSRGQIRSFVERWYAHIASLRGLAADDAQGRAELLKRAIFTNERLIGLAERPLLLTLMASLHAWRGGTLPEKREELYADAVELLLDWWESPKVVRNARGEPLMRQPSLAEWLKVDRDKVRKLLDELAYKVHAAQAELTGTADIAESDLVAGLMRLSQNPDVNPRQLVEYLSVRAGLLIPRGVGVYTFPHRTFQEYMAACYLTDHDYPEKVAELACADINRWREVALLAGAKAGRGTASAIWSLVDALCYANPAHDMPERHQWGAHLAGQALVESGGLTNVSERNQVKLKLVQKWLVNILESGHLPALERARAGDSLGQGNAGEADLSNTVQIGAFTWMISYNGAYTLMSAGEAHLIMELGKKTTICKQAIVVLMQTVHTASEYAQDGECHYAPAQRLKVGDTATILSSSYLRTEPRWDEKTRIRLVSPTEKLTIKITGGPVCAIYNKGEYSYWQVDLSNGKKGYMAEGDLTEYYLAPKHYAPTWQQKNKPASGKIL